MSSQLITKGMFNTLSQLNPSTMQFKPLAIIAVSVLENEFKEESSDTLSAITPVIGTNNCSLKYSWVSNDEKTKVSIYISFRIYHNSSFMKVMFIERQIKS